MRKRGFCLACFPFRLLPLHHPELHTVALYIDAALCRKFIPYMGEIRLFTGSFKKGEETSNVINTGIVYTDVGENRE